MSEYAYQSNSGQDIVYRDYSTTEVAMGIYESSASPDTQIASFITKFIRRLRPPTVLVRVQTQIVTEAPNSGDWDSLTPDERALYMYNAQNPGSELEDDFLVSSGVLDELLDDAMNQSPTEDWERHLDEL